MGAALRFAAGVCAGPVFCASTALARSPSCEQPLERYTLKNGLEVVLRPDHGLPNVAIVASVHAGARNDPPGYEGLAHYVEHLTFREAQSLADGVELYKQAGATGVNATTGLDRTEYFAQLPRAQIERGLWLEARRIAIGLDPLTPVAAEEEHQVILREHELRFGLGINELQPMLMEAIFPEGHPYHGLRRQTESSVAALTLADARWFFARYYRPDRIRLALVGDFEPGAVRPLVDKYFGGLAARELPGAPAQSQAEADAADCKRAEQPGAPLHGTVRITTRAKYEGIQFVWLHPSGDNPERWAGVLDAFARRVGAAVREAKLASGAGLQLVPTELGSYWVLNVDLLPLQPFERVQPLVAQVFAELKKSPPDAGEQNAQRQALELAQSEQRSLLSRALELSQRECAPSQCLAPADQFSPETIAGLDRFDPARALRVELRTSVSASPDGDLERLP
jgi:predicted Zn-dependent peptidase